VGQTFYLTGSASATNCSNQYARMLYYYKLNPGDSWTNPSGASQIFDTYNGSRTGQFSMGPFTASGPAGVKSIYLKVEAYAYSVRGAGTKWGESSFREGYQEYTVVPPAATCSDGILNQNETSIDCGGVCPSCNNGGGSSCTSGVPTGSTQCPNTITNVSAPWTYVASCPATPGNCQYTNDGGGSGSNGDGGNPGGGVIPGGGVVGGENNSITCQLVSPASSVNINTNTIWNATFSTISSLDRIWTLEDENFPGGIGIATTSSSSLTYLFNTTGLKTIKVRIGTSVPCSATTTVQQTGDDNSEI
jgi:hypothetical protein